MLKLILGTAGSGKTALITNEIKRRAAAGEDGLFLIVPEQFSHEAERELCALCGDSFSLHAEVLSFSRLAVRVAQETGTGDSVSLDAGGRLLCMSLALGQIGQRLRVYTGAERKPELQGSILAAIENLKAARLGPEELRHAMQGADGVLLNKLYDLSLCMEAYDAVLSQGYADQTDRLLRLAQTVSQSSIGVRGHIYIDGFTDFTGAEREVISALLKKGAELTVCLTCDGLDGEGEHFAPARAAAMGLISMAEEKGVKTEIVLSREQSDKAAELRALCEGLYQFTVKEQENTDNRVSLYRCEGLRAECELAAAHCLELVQSTGCRFRDIAIAVRGFSAYGAALEETFALYGIPIFTARRESILQKPVPALIAAAFEVISGGWDTDAVLEYIKTGLVPLSLEDSDALECYALRYNIRGGLWTQKKPWSGHPDGLSAEFDDESREQLAHLDALRRELTAPLFVLGREQKRADTAKAQAKALSDFFSAIKLPETLENRAKALEESGYEQLAAEYDRLWSITVATLEQFAAVLGDAPMSGGEFQKLYLRLLSQYDVSVIPVSADSVSAGDMDRMRRRRIKHLIILGASDDRLPAMLQTGGLFSDSERETLSELGLELSGGDDVSRELCLIYNCVSLPSDSITISWPAADPAGAECRPSFLVRRAQMIFGMEEKRFKSEEARLSSPEPAFLSAAEYAGGGQGSPLAYDYFLAHEDSRERLNTLRTRAARTREKLSESAIGGLYGGRLSMSPSKADDFCGCPFKFFLRYGLRLNEQKTADFDAPELGTFTHYVLENVARELAEGVGFKAADEKLTGALCEKYTEKYAAEQLNGFSDKSPRFIYLFRRLRPAVSRIVWDMVRELGRSDFMPLDFELSFMKDGELPPVLLSDGERELQINGIADRVDGYEKDGRLYLRVIDYKTGKKAFSFTNVWYGMSLQMLLYLFSLEREGQQRYGKEIALAGVLYVPARDDIVSAPGDMSDEQIAEAKQKKLRRSGLVLDDTEIIEAMEHGEQPEYIPVKFKNGEISSDSLASSEQLGLLKKHVEGRMLELCGHLKSGGIEAEPYYKSEDDNACAYCKFASVCRFDEERDKRRYLEKLEPQEFWKRLEERA